MFAATLAAIATLEVVFFGEYDIPLSGVVIIFSLCLFHG
jgi:hypothetical protein